MKRKQHWSHRVPRKWQITLGLTLILLPVILFTYLLLRDDKVYEKDLEKLEVTLIYKPIFEHYKGGKGSRHHYYEITFIIKEFKSVFVIYSETYKATDVNGISNNISSGNKIEIKVPKSEIKDLKNKKFPDETAIYGIAKNGVEYVDLDRLNEMTRKGQNYFIAVILAFLAFVPFIFIKDDPKRDEHDIMLIIGIVLVVSMVVVYFLNKYNIL